MERRRKQRGHRAPKDPCCIKIFNSQTSLPIKASQVRRLVSFILGKKKYEISFYFVGMRKMQNLHEKHFSDPSPTDCMTFPLSPNHCEIFICPKAAIAYNPKDPYKELSLYIIHSLLHLLGHDDIDKMKRAKMRKEEKRLMASAKKHQCLLS
jgi:probable rRNA maturation factor